MEHLRINPVGPLSGEVTIDGAKNAVSKLLVACLLADSDSVIHGVPAISEVHTVIQMLRDLGASVDHEGDRVRITPTIATSQVNQRYGGVNRIPILLLSVLTARLGTATVPLAGGCRIGDRGIDFHIDGLTRLGARTSLTDCSIAVTAAGLTGTQIKLDYPSVGATENLMLAATLARGTTVISNAAMEPEIVDLALFLQKMGALILIDSDRRILIEGVSKLHGCEHTVVPDRIEAASYALAAMATGGSVFLRNARQEHMMTFLNVARRMGADFKVDAAGISVVQQGPLRGVHIESDVHPGFATDWVQPLVACLPLADQISVIHETVYERRLGFTDALASAGATISLATTCLGSRTCRFHNRDFPHSLAVAPGPYTRPLVFDIPDLRGGFAYLIASLVAPGTSRLGGLHYLDRGYSDVEGKLAALGADILRVVGPAL